MDNNKMMDLVFGTNNFNGLLSKGVQNFFLNGKNFTLAEVWVGVHSGGNGKVWMECSVLHWGEGIETPYRLVKTEDGVLKAEWSDKWEAWMPDYQHRPTPKELGEEYDRGF